MTLNMRNVEFDGSSMVYIGRGPGGRSMANSVIGRKGWLGNPVTLKDECPVCNQRHRHGGSTLRCYEVLLRSRIALDPEFRDALRSIGGKDLVCWCSPGPCHGDILRKYIDAFQGGKDPDEGP